MTNSATSSIVLFLALSVFAQDSAPDWIEESWRSARYPRSEWYIGFATDKIREQPSSKEYQAIEASAKNMLSESIIVNVQSASTFQATSRQTQDTEIINKSFDQNILIKSNAVLAKVDIKSYFDKKSGYIYGFASVKKKDLADFYRSNINSLFAVCEKEFTIAEQFAEQGKKNLAFAKIQAIEDSLKNINHWGFLLQVVESDNSYIQREKDFWQKLNNAKLPLENSTVVYLDISGVGDSDDFAAQLGAQMQEKKCNCTITKNAGEADYVAKIKIKFERCVENKANKNVYCYANANATVNNSKYKKPLDVKIPEAKGGWASGNTEKATEKTFEELKKNLAEKIVQTISK